MSNTVIIRQVYINILVKSSHSHIVKVHNQSKPSLIGIYLCDPVSKLCPISDLVFKSMTVTKIEIALSLAAL